MPEQAAMIELTPKDIDAIERLLASNAIDAAAKLYAGIFRCGMKDARRLVSQAIADLGNGRTFAPNTRPVVIRTAELGRKPPQTCSRIAAPP